MSYANRIRSALPLPAPYQHRGDAICDIAAEADATIAQLVEALERAFVALQDYGMPLNCAVGRQIAAALKAAKGEA